MKVAIVTCLLAKGYMYIDACQWDKLFSFAKKRKMFHATVNNRVTFEIRPANTGLKGTIDGSDYELDVVANGKDLHVLLEGKSYNVEVVSVDSENKALVIKVNNQEHEVRLKDRFDDLLKSLGMEGAGVKKVKEVKAPMPGMVLKILVEAGNVVEKDQALFILEAMKMENVIKSPSEGTVKRVAVVQGSAVDKNAVLLEFE